VRQIFPCTLTIAVSFQLKDELLWFAVLELNFNTEIETTAKKLLPVVPVLGEYEICTSGYLLHFFSFFFFFFHFGGFQGVKFLYVCNVSGLE